MPPEPETARRSRFGGLLKLLLAALQVLSPARVRAAPVDDETLPVDTPEPEPNAGSPGDGGSDTATQTNPDDGSTPVAEPQVAKSGGLRHLFVGALAALRDRWLRWAPTESPRPNPIDSLDASVLAARTALARIDDDTGVLLAELGMDHVPTLRELEEAGASLATEIERRDRYDHAARETEDARAADERTATRLREAEDALAEARRNAEAAEGEWSAWVECVGFSANFRPSAVYTAIGRIGELRTLHGQLRDQRGRTDRMHAAIDTVETDLRRLVGTAGLLDFEHRRASQALAELTDRSDRAKRARDSETRLQRESEAWTETRNSLAVDLEVAQRELDALLAKGDAADVDEYRRVAEGVEQRRGLADRLKNIRSDSPYLTGPHAREIESELRSVAHEAVESEREELRVEITRLEDERSELDKQLGDLDRQQRQLADATRTAEIQERLGQMAATAREDSARWAVLTLARRLVDETIDQFRKERQPEQLKTASIYFQSFTSGAYSTIRPRLAESRDAAAFEAVLENGQVRQVSELSRATAEQLYLALRFAVVEDFARRNEPLPVLMDDVLVNFDPVRARAACLAIARLSSRFQVLAMTCHPETVDWFREAAPHAALNGGVKVIDLAV